MRHKWTQADIALLGKFSDGKIADRLGISPAAVARVRHQRGIPAFRKSVHWGTTELGLLGRYTDEEVARMTGRPIDEVRAKRNQSV